MDTAQKKLEWKEAYSVGVQEIDTQHKLLFATINQLIDAIGNHLTEEEVNTIVSALVEYKRVHFETEERYFKEFQYEGAEEHIAAHREFGVRLKALQDRCGADVFRLAFELVDFLEDWLIGHLMDMDQQYKDCFAVHGLK